MTSHHTSHTSVGARLALAGMLLLGGVDDRVQAAEPALLGEIVEAYSPSVNVGSASGALVGLWLGTPPKSLDIREIRMVVPPSSQPQNLCFSAVTRDGEYTARGSVRAPKRASGPLPISKLQKSNYVVELSRYDSLDVAVSARWGTDCAIKPASPYLPAVGGSDRSILVAAINSAHAISVSADLVAGSDVVKGECVPNLPGRSRAFDTRCTFVFPAEVASTSWRLQLTRLPRAGARRIDDFELLVQR